MGDGVWRRTEKREGEKMEETRERKGDGGTEEGHSVGAAADWHGLIGEKWMGGVRKARRRGGREGGRGEAERKLGACHVSNSSYWTWLSTPRLNLEPPPHPAVAALNAVQQSSAISPTPPTNPTPTSTPSVLLLNLA